jgi:hypothetical protein
MAAIHFKQFKFAKANLDIARKLANTINEGEVGDQSAVLLLSAAWFD